jgi:GNAT superfamily N-acetyltransferase
MATNHWQHILKTPFPNRQVGNRKDRGGRKIIEGTGPMGSFKYNEVDKIHRAVKRRIDFNYRNATKKLIDKEQDANKHNEIKQKMDEQKTKNVYITNYGSYKLSGFMGQYGAAPDPNTHDWFAGRFKGLGYNPRNPEDMTEMGTVLSLTAKHPEFFREAAAAAAKLRGEKIETELEGLKEGSLDNRTLAQFRKKLKVKQLTSDIWFNSLKKPELKEEYAILPPEQTKGDNIREFARMYKRGEIVAKPMSEWEIKIIHKPSAISNEKGVNPIAAKLIYVVMLGQTRTTWLADINTMEKHRNKGLANALLENLIELRGSNPIDGLIKTYDDTGLGMSQLESLYRKHGFTLTPDYDTNNNRVTSFRREP